MAARKGKTKTAKVKSLKSKRLNADQAGQVKGGLLPAVNVAQKLAPSTAWKWSPSVSGIAWK